jgi:hypothetical protein
LGAPSGLIHLNALPAELATVPCNAKQEHSMLDVIVLALAAVFFVVSIGYAYVCDRL